MQQPAARLAILAVVAALALALVLCVLVVPGWLHPPLSSAQLQAVTSAERRVELQQAQERLQEDARATLLPGIAGVLLAVGAIAAWRQVQVSREGQITERFSAPSIISAATIETFVLAASTPWNESPRTLPPTVGRSSRSSAPLFATTHPGTSVHPTGRNTPRLRSMERLPRLDFRAPDVQGAVGILGTPAVSGSGGTLLGTRRPARRFLDAPGCPTPLSGTPTLPVPSCVEST